MSSRPTFVDWKYPAPGTEYTNGKLIHFTTHSITVTKPWPPQRWQRTIRRPWRHAPVRFSVMGGADQALRGQLEEVWAQLFATPSIVKLAVRDKEGRWVTNHDGTIGLPFEAGWQSPLPQLDGERPPSRGHLRHLLADIQFNLMIPQRARAAVRSFDPSQQAALLGLLQRGGEPAYDLLRSNPALALGLVNLPLFIPGLAKPWRSAAALLKHRQRHIAARLGFPPVEASVRLLRKLGKQGLKAKHLLFLRTALREDPALMRTLAHLPRLGRRELPFITMPQLRPVLTPAFVHQVASLGPDDRGTYPQLVDTLMMGRLVHGPDWRPRPLQSLAQLHRLHAEMIELSSIVEQDGAPFAEPPIPGNELIQPLASPRALMQEAQAMRNCVAAYSSWVRSGWAYVYHVDLPQQECTLSLVPAGTGRWQVGELKSFANHEPSARALKSVREWLAGHPAGAVDGPRVAPV